MWRCRFCASSSATGHRGVPGGYGGHHGGRVLLYAAFGREAAQRDLGIIAAMLYPLSVFLLGLNGALYVSLALLLALIVWYVFWMRARVPTWA